MGDAGRGLAARVEPDQLARELLDGLAGTALQQQPGLAAELRQRGRLRVGADVARDLSDLLVRDVQPVLAAEAEEQVVARDAGDLLRLETEQLPDPVVLVDDVVAGAEVGEGLKRAAEPGAGARRTLAEDLRVREQDEPEVAPDEPPPGRRDREEEARLVRELPALLEPLDLEATEQGRGAEAVAAVREGDDDALARADEGGQLVLGLGEPPRRDRRPLGLEGVRLATRERIELRRPFERHRIELLLLPDALDLLRLEDEVGRAVEHRHQVVGDSGLFALVQEGRLDEIQAALRRGVDRRTLDRVQSALRERREGADRLDLVAEELDPERLAARGREHVDEPATHGELSALVDPLDALVTRERKLLGETLDAGLLACGEVDPLGTLAGRR